MNYEKLNNTYSAKPKDNPKDRIEVEIGDSKQVDFHPQIKIMRWDNEVNFSARLKTDIEQKPSIDGNKIKTDNIHFYELEDGYEFEVILKDKPKSNVVEFTLETKGLDFFYQPELTKKEIGDGVIRPENVIGSYAVYASEKKINYVGGKEYKTGKVGHIYRPRIEDSNGKWVWGNLNIKNKKLTVTIPQEFLDKAVYPVRHAAGLTFGYTSNGATEANMTPDFVFATKVAPASTGVGGSVSVYCKRADSSVHPSVKGGLWASTGGLAIVTNGIGGATSADDDTIQWRTSSFASAPSLVASTDYYAGVIASDYGKIGFDSLANAGYYDSSNSYTTPQDLGSVSNNAARYSIYCTYTAGGGSSNKTFSVDGKLWKQSTKTLNVDALLFSRKIKTLSVDAALYKRNTKTFTVDALIQSNTTMYFQYRKVGDVDWIETTHNSAAVGSFSDTVSLDPNTDYEYRSVVDWVSGINYGDIVYFSTSAAGSTKTLTVDALLYTKKTKTFASDALLYKTRTKTFAIDALLYSTETKTLAVDGLLYKTKIKTLTVDALLFAREIKSFSVDAVLAKAEQTKTFTLDARLFGIGTKPFTCDADLWKTQTLDFICDALLVTRKTKTLTVDALIYSQKTKAVDVDALLLYKRFKSFTVDGLLYSQKVKNVSVDGLLYKQSIKEFGVDALLYKIVTKDFSADALLYKEMTQTFTADALLWKQIAKNITVDALLYTTEIIGLSIDAFLVNRKVKTFEVDALLIVMEVSKNIHGNILTEILIVGKDNIKPIAGMIMDEKPIVGDSLANSVNTSDIKSEQIIGNVLDE